MEDRSRDTQSRNLVRLEPVSAPLSSAARQVCYVDCQARQGTAFLKPESNVKEQRISPTNDSTVTEVTQRKDGAHETCLYIRVHDVIDDIRKLRDVLSARVDSEKVDFRPTESAIPRSHTHTYCSLTCPSKNQAKKLRSMLMKDRHMFTPLIDCSFEPYDQKDVTRRNLELQKEKLREVVVSEFNARSEELLKAHTLKLEGVLERTQRAQENLHDLHKYEETKHEIEALKHKQAELENQREEFKRALDRFNCDLTTLLVKDTFEREIQNLRKQFGVECSRMERSLPVYARRRDIIELVKHNQVSIIVAETGSGKSTQIVQYLQGTDLAEKGTIVCTQPRKVAAVSLATHVAKELATSVGSEVGYKVGSAYKRSASTKVVFMTDHSLLNECLEDPDLEKFSCIVVDEAHERSLYTDLLLGMIKRCMKKRPELRVIITSATIDPEVFVKFFGGNCPVMKISGRTFPVEVVWEDADNEETDFDNYEDEAVKKAIEIHMNEPPGDILVFLTSRIEIEKCCESFEQKMRTMNRTDFQCFPLHGQLQPDEQQKVFEPLGRNKRKIVFATNCAETSITIDGIKYVVDTGVAKEMRYDAKKNVNSLSVTIISKSSADQRKGRAGRTAPGKCYRLYSQRSYNDMDAISLPEILKTHLGQALLKLAELGIGPDMYDFVQSPSPDAISAALESLVQLGAMENGKITETGRWMARLPFDPKLGLLTLLGKNEDILYDAIALAAVINAGSGVFYRGTTPEAQKKLDKAKSKFSSAGGDFLTSLKVYKEWQMVPERQKARWCMDNSINAKVVRGIRDNINEVAQVLKKELNLHIEHRFSGAERTNGVLQKMVFRCYSANLCHYLGKERAGYFAARACRQVHIHPSSSLNALAIFPEWVVYDEILKTSRDFIIGITPVEESWLGYITREKFGFDVEDIRMKQVLNVCTHPAGSHVFFALVGPRYTKLREYEEQCTESSTVVIVEASRDRGEVKVFSTEITETVVELTQSLEDTVQAAVDELEDEDREIPVGREDSELRAILGPGGQVLEILMPHQSRKVFITKPSGIATEKAILTKFRQFGQITFHKQFSEGKNWGFVVYRSAQGAAKAVEGTKDDPCYSGQLERRRHGKYNSELKANLSWCRRPCIGFGFVKVSQSFLSTWVGTKRFYIGDKLVEMRKDFKKADSLYLKGLPDEVTEDVVKRCLLRSVAQDENAKGIVKKVTVPRERVGNTTQKELQKLESEIRQTLKARLPTSAVKVVVRKPDFEHRSMFQAEAFFSNPVEGIKACEDFHLPNGQLVTVEPVMVNTLTIPKRVFDAYKDRYLDVENHVEGADVQIRHQAKSVLIRIKAKKPEDVIKARMFLGKAFKGDVLDYSFGPNLRHLLTAAGRKFLQQAGEEAGAYVCVDDKLYTVTTHGDEQACTEVREKIREYLLRLGNGSADEEVTLKGSDNPPGLLKALITKHGDDLDGFRSDFGLHSVTVDYRRHKLKLTGTPVKIQKAKYQIQATKNQLWATTKEARPEEDDIECPACFCPIEISELYRLQICAHPYCRGCFSRMVTIAIKDRDLPIVCCYDGCERPLAWRDFNNLARAGDIQLTKLTTAAVDAFVRTNRSIARPCPSPDCPMVYRVSSEEHPEVFQCPECDTRTCTACHTQAHDGLICSSLRLSTGQAHMIKKWAARDRSKRIGCPGCEFPIEKLEGCDKMRCSLCKTIFCWRCGEKFSTETACHGHLKNCPRLPSSTQNTAVPAYVGPYGDALDRPEPQTRAARPVTSESATPPSSSRLSSQRRHGYKLPLKTVHPRALPDEAWELLSDSSYSKLPCRPTKYSPSPSHRGAPGRTIPSPNAGQPHSSKRISGVGLFEMAQTSGTTDSAHRDVGNKLHVHRSTVPTRLGQPLSSCGSMMPHNQQQVQPRSILENRADGHPVTDTGITVAASPRGVRRGPEIPGQFAMAHTDYEGSSHKPGKGQKCCCHIL